MRELNFNHDSKSDWPKPGTRRTRYTHYTDKPIKPIEITSIYHGVCSHCKRKHLNPGDRIVKTFNGWAAKKCLEAANRKVTESADSL